MWQRLFSSYFNPGAYEGLITQLSKSQHRVCSLQVCPSTQELQNSLRQAQNLLASHEASYLQSLRSLKRKISQLQNSTARMPSRPGDGNSSSFWREKKQSVTDHVITHWFIHSLFLHSFLSQIGRSCQRAKIREGSTSGSWGSLLVRSGVRAGGVWDPAV